MAWSEPLRLTTTERANSIVAELRDTNGTIVASVICPFSADAKCGYFGSVTTEPGGTPRQTARALVLLTRTALKWAADHGITTVETDAPPGLRALAARISGLSHVGGTFRGDTAATLSTVLNRTMQNGDEA